MTGGWNKGLTKFTSPTLARWSQERAGFHYSPATEIKKGQRISPETEFKTSVIRGIRKSESLGYVVGVVLGDGCIYVDAMKRGGGE